MTTLHITYHAAAEKYGTVDHGGAALALTQQAYCENYGTDGGVRYYASAVDIEGNEYRVSWDTTQAWDAATAAAKVSLAESGELGNEEYLLQDESNACDWDSPADITPV